MWASGGWYHSLLLVFGPAQIFASQAMVDTAWHGEIGAHSGLGAAAPNTSLFVWKLPQSSYM